MLWLESFFNTQTDWNWGWGPFLKYRPAKCERMGLACYMLYGLALPFGVMFSILLIATYWFLNAPSQIVRSPLLFGSLCLWVTDTYWLAFVVGPIVVLPLAGAYIASWNRRADRLTRQQPDLT